MSKIIVTDYSVRWVLCNNDGSSPVSCGTIRVAWHPSPTLTALLGFITHATNCQWELSLKPFLKLTEEWKYKGISQSGSLCYFFSMPLDWIEEEKSAKLYNKLDKVGLVDNRPSAN